MPLANPTNNQRSSIIKRIISGLKNRSPYLLHLQCSVADGSWSFLNEIAEKVEATGLKVEHVRVADSYWTSLNDCKWLRDCDLLILDVSHEHGMNGFQIFNELLGNPRPGQSFVITSKTAQTCLDQSIVDQFPLVYWTAEALKWPMNEFEFPFE